MTALVSCEGPKEFFETYEVLVSEVLKNHFPAAVRRNALMREAVVAGVWLGLVTFSNPRAGELLRTAISNGLPPYDSAVVIARQLGWSPGDVIENTQHSLLG